MHIKFVKPKSPVAQIAINYVLRAGKKPNPNEKVTVLRGNPQDVARVADALKYKHKYSSAVIAWHENDAPTEEQINQVLNDFERLAFAGLDEQQYTFAAVQHEEKDGTKHIHIITPRTDLVNDKSMNIAPPNSFKAFDALRDYHNFKHGWKSPDIAAHPENARTLQLGFNRGNRKELNEAINQFVNASIISGDIKDRASVVAALQKQGLEITKQSKNFITIKTADMEKGMRLKGAIYGKDFNISTHEQLARFSRDHGATNPTNKGKTQENAQSSFREFEARFNRAIQKRAEYNAKGIQAHSTKLIQQMASQAAPRPQQVGWMVGAYLVSCLLICGLVWLIIPAKMEVPQGCQIIQDQQSKMMVCSQNAWQQGRGNTIILRLN